MKKSISFKMCLRHCCILFGYFCLFAILGMLFGIIGGTDGLLIGLYCGLGVGIVVFLPPMIYYIVTAALITKRCKGVEVQVGTVQNWDRAAVMRIFASISIKSQDKEYSTQTYFLCSEAREFVGKTVKYHIVDGTLYILEFAND